MDLYKQLGTFGKVRLNEPLAKHTTFKIGGPADFFITVDEIDKLVALLKFLDGDGISYFILGGGSNMLVGDEGYQGVVIQCRMQNVECRMDKIVADAGCVTVELARQSIKAGLTGFEWGVGVPGTIGGAVRGNAGAMGGEMKDVVEKVEVYRSGEVIELTNHQCHFGYRESVFKHHTAVILRVTLQLKKMEDVSGEAGGMKKALELIQYRNKTQPQGWASTGCIFKNVELLGEHGEPNRVRLLEHFDNHDPKVQQFLHVGKISAGWLVEQVGMKGAKVGQAEVSPQHGNFIVNLGGASATDVKTLIEKIKEQVYDRYGIELEEEIQII